MRLGIRQTQVPKRFQTIGLSLDPIRYHFQSRSKGLDGLELHVARMIGPENYQSIYQAFAHSVPLSDREVPRAWNFRTRSRVAQRLDPWGSKGLESSSFRIQISDPESSKGLESLNPQRSYALVPPRRWAEYAYVKVRNFHYRSLERDRNKTTCHRYFKSVFKVWDVHSEAAS